MPALHLFSLQASTSLTPYLFNSTDYAYLWSMPSCLISSQRKAARMFRDGSTMQNKARYEGTVERFALKSALWIKTEKLM